MTADVPGKGAGTGIEFVEAAASAALAEVLVELSREFEEQGDAPAADLTVWLAVLYARIGSFVSAGEADASMEEAPGHAYAEAAMLRVAERLDRESAYLRGAALDPTNTVAFLAARSAEALVEMLRNEAAETGDA